MLEDFGSQFALFIEQILLDNDNLWLKFRESYVTLARIKGSSKVVRLKRAGSEYYRIVRERSRPRPQKAWMLFEALRLAGVEWCSGLLGLFAAGYLTHVVGTLQCSREYWDGSESVDRLAEIVASALAALGVDQETSLTEPSRIEDDRLSAARKSCTLDAELHHLLTKGFHSWTSLPTHEVGALCRRDRHFPLAAYTYASDQTRTLVHRAQSVFHDRFWANWAIRNDDPMYFGPDAVTEH